MTTPIDPMKLALLDAILPHVAFDGWSPLAFDAAVAELGLPVPLASALCPRGAVDLAVLFHHQGDDAMAAAMAEHDLGAMRYRDRVAEALWLRLSVVQDKEAVRRGSALFALPHMAPEGSTLMWGTADRIWTALGDSSDDVNWYTKRMTLSAVYSAVVLYWLGDEDPDLVATRAFIDRRIENVMQFEKFKAQVRGNAVLKPLTALVQSLTSGIRAPSRMPDADLPGVWRKPGQAED